MKGVSRKVAAFFSARGQARRLTHACCASYYRRDFPRRRRIRQLGNSVNLIKTLFSPEPHLFDVAILVLRLFLGICFVVHGLGKLGIVGPGNMAGFVGWLKSLGVPFAAVQARAAMLSEIVGGSLIAIGLFTRPAAAVVFFTMIVAATIGHKGGGYLITNTPPGNEYALNLAMFMVVLLMLGPGRYSLDCLWFS